MQTREFHSKAVTIVKLPLPGEPGAYNTSALHSSTSRFVEDLPDFQTCKDEVGMPDRQQASTSVGSLARQHSSGRPVKRAAERKQPVEQGKRSNHNLWPTTDEDTHSNHHSSQRVHLRSRLKKRPPKMCSRDIRLDSYLEWRQSMITVVSADVSRRSSTRQFESPGTVKRESEQRQSQRSKGAWNVLKRWWRCIWVAHID